VSTLYGRGRGAIAITDVVVDASRSAPCRNSSSPTHPPGWMWFATWVARVRPAVGFWALAGYSRRAAQTRPPRFRGSGVGGCCLTSPSIETSQDPEMITRRWLTGAPGRTSSSPSLACSSDAPCSGEEREMRLVERRVRVMMATGSEMR
jgi:hypothetical protein